VQTLEILFQINVLSYTFMSEEPSFNFYQQYEILINFAWVTKTVVGCSEFKNNFET